VNFALSKYPDSNTDGIKKLEIIHVENLKEDLKLQGRGESLIIQLIFVFNLALNS